MPWRETDSAVWENPVLSSEPWFMFPSLSVVGATYRARLQGNSHQSLLSAQSVENGHSSQAPLTALPTTAVTRQDPRCHNARPATVVGNQHAAHRLTLRSTNFWQ